MRDAPRVSVVSFSSCSPRDQATGLLGWITLEVDGLSLSGVALRKTRGGYLALSFPERRDSRGRRHSLIRPLDDEARKAIEARVLGALEEMGVMP